MDALASLSIERACARLVTRYCHLVDHGAACEVADLFTVDGVWTSAETTMTGRAEIAHAFGLRQNNLARRSRHVCNNLLLEIEGPQAVTGVVYVTLYRHDGDPARPVAPLEGPTLVGEYRDRFVLTDEGWRIGRREVVVSFLRREPEA